MIDSLLEFFQTHVLNLEHAPFKGVVFVFWIIGHFMSTSVFTRARAYAKGKFQWFFWWGRESLELHPILSGCLLGMIWVDPEKIGMNMLESMLYFAAAGVCSLFVWALVKSVMKKNNISGFRLPGESERPKSS